MQQANTQIQTQTAQQPAQATQDADMTEGQAYSQLMDTPTHTPTQPQHTTHTPKPTPTSSRRLSQIPPPTPPRPHANNKRQRASISPNQSQ